MDIWGNSGMAMVARSLAVATSHSFRQGPSSFSPPFFPPAETRVLPSGEKAKDKLTCPFPGMLARFLPVVESHSCTDSPPIARVLLSGENAREPDTSSFIFSFPVATSHNLTTLGLRGHPEVARVLPSGENARDTTPPLSPFSWSRSLPVATSQSFSLTSNLSAATSPVIEARVLPSGENATL